MTILPGIDETNDTPPDPPRRSFSAPSRPVVLLVVLAVLAAGFGAWKLLGSGGTTEPVASIAPPATGTAKQPAKPRIPAHGPVTAKQLRAVATPVFVAANAALGGWEPSKQLEIRPAAKSMDAVSRRIARCAGVTRGAGLVAISPLYTQSTKFAGATLGVFANHRGAARDAAVGTSAPVRDCATRILPAAMAKQGHADSISYRKMSSFKVPGIPGATGYRLLVGLLGQGREVPIAIDTLDVALGRTHVSLTVSNAVMQAPHSTEVAALAAMVKQLRTSLR